MMYDPLVHEWPLRYFTPQELTCRCCGKLKLNIEAAARLDRARELLGSPMFLLSAYRCKKHNESVGGAVKSQHLLGGAFDIKTFDRWTQLKTFDALYTAGFTGFGFYHNFIHADVGTRRCWVHHV